MTDMQKLEQFVWEKCGSIAKIADVSTDENPNRWGIIPAEITLSHVLMAIRLSFVPIYNDSVMKFYHAPDYSCMYFSWDLTKNFSEQSEDTKIAIAKLLGWKDE